jgi:beta-mannosidase
VSSHVYTELREGWQCAALPPEAAVDPPALERSNADWLPAVVPGTVAAALRANGCDLFRDKPALDSIDHWYRCTFAGPERADGSSVELAFDGLATLSEVWLNGERLLESDNMFVPQRASVSERLRASNELAIRFRSLDRWLEQKRPRPRWRSRLTDHAQLRWARTSLLGRMPGWSPPVHAVGPWRPIRLVVQRDLEVAELSLAADVIDLVKSTGRVRVRLVLRALEPRISAMFERGTAELCVGDSRAPLRRNPSGTELALEGEVELQDVQLWWPHTHGSQPLYPARVRLAGGGKTVDIELGSVGFRKLELDSQAGRFQLRVNGAPVFCRGACWTTTDIATLTGSSAAYDADLSRARDAGMNMLRLSGTMFYEADEFYRRCDELGILIWQDFMFANMDYPIADPTFAASVEREVDGFLRRTQTNPSLAVLCGGSEVEQQVAMLGLPREVWRSALFDEVLPAHVRRLRPDVVYWPNSPSGGDLPFEANSGVTHYYGVGAYLRPLEDARRAEVKFAAECLAFANMPSDATIAQVLKDGQALVHPNWKERVPRDAGASWDFEDLRDHYLKLLFACDPNALRYEDPDRYVALSRVVTGEVMANALGEWRRARSTCRGALIWFYRDLWPGAGLGLLDANGRPKPAYFFVQRALAPTTVWFSDEGLNGLHVHLAHDAATPMTAELRISLHHDANGSVVANATVPVELETSCSRELRVNAILPWFSDTTRAYRFGPPAHDLVVATLSAEGRVLAEALYFPLGLPARRTGDLGLRARAVRGAGESWELHVTSQRLAYAVEIDVPGYEPAQNHLHVAPGSERVFALRPIHAAEARAPHERSGVHAAAPAGTLRALNSNQTVKIAIESLAAAEREPTRYRGTT